MIKILLLRTMMEKLLSHKGQFFSADVMLSILIFLTILISFFSTHAYFNRTVENQEVENDMSQIAISLSSLLVETGGYPDNWETFKKDDLLKDKGDKDKKYVFAIGLSKNADGWNLNQKKIDKFVELNSSYNFLKDTLGVKGAGYEFYANVSVPSKSYVVGVYPTKAENVVNVERSVLVEGQRGKFNLKVWENA